MGSNKIQSLDNSQTKLLALLIFLNGDVLNVPDHTERMDELALNNQTASPDDSVCTITDHEHVVLIIARGNPIVPLVPCLLGDLANSCQHAQHVQIAARVVRAAHWPDCVVCWQEGDHFRGDEGGGEEGTVGDRLVH